MNTDVVVERTTRRYISQCQDSGDTRVEKKEQDEVDKYQNLARELKRLWKANTNIVSIVVGALGTIPKGLEKNLKTAGTTVSIELFQKAALQEQNGYSEKY